MNDNNNDRAVVGSISTVSMGNMVDLVNKLNQSGIKINAKDIAVISAQDLAISDKIQSPNKVKIK